MTAAPERTGVTPVAPGPPRSGTTFLGLPTAPRGVGHLRGDRPFPEAARDALRDGQLRANLGHATSTIRRKRAAVVGEVPDWEQLRQAGKAIKTATMARLDEHLVELPAAEQCCGFGGTFAVKNADTSTAMLTDKMANVLSTHAEVCTAGDASCLMHIGGGLSRLRSGTRTVHLAEILASTEDAVSPHQTTRPAVSA